MPAEWRQGNAAVDGSATRGWILGHFIDPAVGVRSTRDVEVKWGIHPPGEKRAEWAPSDQRTTMVILVDGMFRVELAGHSATLARQGDYLAWAPGTGHAWEALAPSVVITIRWPSAPPPDAGATQD
jgi:hypothetical protein